MSRTEVSRAVLYLAVVLTWACERGGADLAPSVVTAIQREAAALLVPRARPPLLAGGGEPGDAAADYLSARAGLSTLPPVLDETARVRHGRFPGGRMPDEIRTALAAPAARAIVDAVLRGAGRDRIRSPFAAAIAPAGYLQLLPVADVVVMSAQAAQDAGRPAAAADMLLATARMGQDLTHHSHLLGHTVGTTISRRAAEALIATLGRASPSAEELDAVRVAYRRLLADQPTPRDALIDEARLLLVSAGAAARMNLGFDASGLTRLDGDLLAAAGGPAGFAARTAAALAAYQALADAPPAELARAAHQACAAAFGDGFDGCGPHDKILQVLAERLAAVRAGYLVVSLRAHAATHGGLPEELGALGGALPGDPLTGLPFGYARTGDVALLTAGPLDRPTLRIDVVVPPRAPEEVVARLAAGPLDRPDNRIDGVGPPAPPPAPRTR